MLNQTVILHRNFRLLFSTQIGCRLCQLALQAKVLQLILQKRILPIFYSISYMKSRESRIYTLHSVKADLEKANNALSDIKTENNVLAFKNSRMQSKIDFLVQCHTCQTSLITTEGAKICNGNTCDINNSILVTDDVENSVFGKRSHNYFSTYYVDRPLLCTELAATMPDKKSSLIKLHLRLNEPIITYLRKQQ